MGRLFELNGVMLQAFTWNLPADAQHWRRLAKMAPQLANEGFTSVWMPPAYKGAGGIEDVGYGVYDLWDLGEFDQKGNIATKYGTRHEYLTAIRAMQEAGLDVLADIVMNHRLGADATEAVEAQEVAADNRNHILGETETITTWTRFEFPGREGHLNKFTWDHTCFKGIDHDAKSERTGVWLFEGKQWDLDVNSENGNFDYLMGADVDVHDPRVYRQLVAWGKWYLQVTGVDGLRLDAVKHISRAFYLSWLADMRAASGKELFTVGEYWSPFAQDLINYLGSEQAMSLFDVPLHFAFFQASWDRNAIDFSHLLDTAFVTADPMHAVTFVDNHDTQPNQALASTVQPWFKPVAYAYILLRQSGYPCVFFADLYGLPNDAIPAVAELPLLMEIRRRFAFGEQHDYLDQADLAGWTREGSSGLSPQGVAVVLSRCEPEYDEDNQLIIPRKSMYVGRSHAGEVWRCVLGAEDEVVIAEDGVGHFPAGPDMLAVYLPEEAAKALDHIPIILGR